jgi:hypothetical protein
MNEPVIPLQSAFMCADGHISTNSRACAHCGSQIVSLAKVLDREQKETQ